MKETTEIKARYKARDPIVVKEIFKKYQESARKMKEAAKTMRGTKIYAEKEECKSRIENEKIYLTECNKFYRRSYRNLLNQYDE